MKYAESEYNYVSQRANMSRFIPNALVDLILEYAMDQADYVEAARLALVNKRARALYKEQAKLEDRLIEAIRTIKTHTFSVVIKTIVKNKVMGVLKIKKGQAFIIADATIAFADTDPVNFRQKVCSIAKTANMRDVRTKISFSKKDAGVLQVVMQFVEYITAKCTR